MKIILISFLFLILFTNPSFAQSQKSSASDLEKITNKVDALKDKVASRVASLNLVERRGIVGIVDDVSENQIIIVDINEKRRVIEVDELTKFSSNDDDSYGISDIKNGDKISAIGLYNKESQKLLARFVNEISIPIFLTGVISELNDKDFSLTITLANNETLTVDVERTTKSFLYSDGDLESSGFSKFKLLENLVVVGFEDPKDPKRISALKIISFPDIPNDPNIPIIDLETKSSPTPEKSDDE